MHSLARLGRTGVIATLSGCSLQFFPLPSSEEDEHFGIVKVFDVEPDGSLEFEVIRERIRTEFEL